MTTRFGIFCPPAIGHLNPTCILALELQRRGHSVTLFGVPDALAKLENLDIPTWEIGALSFPKGSIDQTYKTLGKLTGREGLKFTIDFLNRETDMIFREAPEAIRAAGIDVLVVDQVTVSAGTVADYLELPFVTVCNAMLINREPSVPPYSTHWTYSTTPWGHFRNYLGNTLINFLTRDLWQKLCDQRRVWNLPPFRKREDAYSLLAQVCQLPKVFDFPRKGLPAHFHYIGRFEDPSGTEPIAFKNIDFPFDRLNGKPLIYASLGTLQNQRPEIFHCIAQGCSALDAQLVISLGNPEMLPMDLPGDPIVVPFAPHQKLIERSHIVITHAGMNTVLTALSCGVPLVAIPITNEQPGIASRLVLTGAGKRIKLTDLDETTLRTAVSEVLKDASYRENAQRLQMAIQSSGGVKRAAEILEQVAQTGQPVTATSVSGTDKS